MIELLIGLKNLKHLGIYHRDIKPGNFLYNPQTRKGVIIDFGLAELDPKYIEKLELKIAKMKEAGDPNLREAENTLKTYKKLA